MRIPALALALAACLALPTLARADTWAPPTTLVATAADGRHVVVVTPERGMNARFLLLKRADGAPAIESPPRGEEVGVPLPGPGDRVLARGACPAPVAVWCLDGDRGFLLFETYGQLGGARVLARYDGGGRLVWKRGLADFFQPAEIAGFRTSVSSVWWYTSRRYDPTSDTVLVIYETPVTVDPDDPIAGPNVGPLREPGLLRVHADDGRAERGTSADLLPLIAKGTLDERLEALDACNRARPAGYEEALRAVFAETEAPLALRVAVAAQLARNGDAHAKDLLLRAAKPGVEARARALALEAVGATRSAEGLDLLRAALREKEISSDLGVALWRGFAAYGADAVGVLATMLEERDAPEHYRNTAIDLLAQLGGDAQPALPALDRVASRESGTVADNARYAAEAIRKASRTR